MALYFRYLNCLKYLDPVDVLDDTTNYTPEFGGDADCEFIYEIENKTSKTLYIKLDCKEENNNTFMASKYLAIPVGKSYKFIFSKDKLDELNKCYPSLCYAYIYLRCDDINQPSGWSYNLKNAYQKHMKLTVSDSTTSEIFRVDFLDGNLNE